VDCRWVIRQIFWLLANPYIAEMSLDPKGKASISAFGTSIALIPHSEEALSGRCCRPGILRKSLLGIRFVIPNEVGIEVQTALDP
jgi:hypothetical protein